MPSNACGLIAPHPHSTPECRSHSSALHTKACIAKQTKEHDFPPDIKHVNKVYSHKLSDLLSAAGLEEASLERSRQSGRFELNWSQVQTWSEKSRYAPRGETQARDLILAISDNQEGVLSWIKRHW